MPMTLVAAMGQSIVLKQQKMSGWKEDHQIRTRTTFLYLASILVFSRKGFSFSLMTYQVNVITLYQQSFT